MRTHYFRPVLTLIENEDGGYDAIFDFGDSYIESSIEGTDPVEYANLVDDEGAERACKALDRWISVQATAAPSLDPGEPGAFRFEIH